jgi:hypothetical protein
MGQVVPIIDVRYSPKADILRPAASQKKRDRHSGRSPQFACLAFGNNWRWRRGFALAVVPVSVLCAASDANESQSRRSQ